MAKRTLLFVLILGMGIACTLAQTAKTEKREGPTGMKPQQEEPEVTQKATVSSIEKSVEVKVLHQVKPVYPAAAKAAGIEGLVLLEATVDTKGSVSQLCLLEGNPALVGSAVEAVWQWKYEPLVLNGQPVDVSTRITVDYKLKNDKQKTPTK